MFTLTAHQSPGKRNLDYAFPPFAPGLPSVFERAGFDVNKNSKSNCSSAAGSISSSPRSIRSGFTPDHSASSIKSKQDNKLGKLNQNNHSAPQFKQNSNSSLNISASKPQKTSMAASSAPQLKAPHGTLKPGFGTDLPNPGSKRSSKHSNKSDFSFDFPRKLPIPPAETQPSGKSLNSHSRQPSNSSALKESRSLDSDLSDSMPNPQPPVDIFDPGLNHQNVYGGNRAFQSTPVVNKSIPNPDEMFNPANHRTTWHENDAGEDDYGNLDMPEQVPQGYQEHKLPSPPQKLRFRESKDSVIPDDPAQDPAQDPYQSGSQTTSTDNLAIPALNSHAHRGSTTSSIYSFRQSKNLSESRKSAESKSSFDFDDEELPEPMAIPPAPSANEPTPIPDVDNIPALKEPTIPGLDLESTPEATPEPQLQEPHALQSLSNMPSVSSLNSSTKQRKQCRGCMQIIQGKSVKSADNALTGRWHRDCFNCTRCSTQLFGKQKAHVLNDNPYCGDCYHLQNNSTCRRCGGGIEGSCLETRSEEGFEPLLYHTSCLQCVKCNIRLFQSYFEVQGETYCAEHAFTSLPKNSNVHQRYTQFMLM